MRAGLSGPHVIDLQLAFIGQRLHGEGALVFEALADVFEGDVAPHAIGRELKGEEGAAAGGAHEARAHLAPATEKARTEFHLDLRQRAELELLMRFVSVACVGGELEDFVAIRQRDDLAIAMPELLARKEVPVLQPEVRCVQTAGEEEAEREGDGAKLQVVRSFHGGA